MRYSIAEAAARLGISERTLYRRMKAGDIQVEKERQMKEVKQTPPILKRVLRVLLLTVLGVVIVYVVWGLCLCMVGVVLSILF